MAADRSLIIIAALAIALTLVSCSRSRIEAAGDNASSPQGIISLDEKNFLLAADRSELGQKTLAEIGLERVQNVNVREFAKRVLEERQQELSSLDNLLQAKKITVPAVRTREIQDEVVQRLGDPGQDGFDHQFVTLFAAEQQELVRLFDRAAYTSIDPDIKRYAVSLLPVMRQDLAIAGTLQANVTATPE